MTQNVSRVFRKQVTRPVYLFSKVRLLHMARTLLQMNDGVYTFPQAMRRAWTHPWGREPGATDEAARDALVSLYTQALDAFNCLNYAEFLVLHIVSQDLRNGKPYRGGDCIADFKEAERLGSIAYIDAALEYYASFIRKER